MSSRLISTGIIEASQRVREGKSLHEALAAGKLMPEMGLEMIEVGEASGALAAMLASVAEFYEEETSLRLSTLIAVVEPAILVFMAVVIAFILISLYLPIFSFSMGARQPVEAPIHIMGTTESNFTPAELQDVQQEREHSQKLAERYRCPFVDLNSVRIDPELFRVHSGGPDVPLQLRAAGVATTTSWSSPWPIPARCCSATN